MNDARLQHASGRNLIGAVLGNYRIIGEISAGGMGAVYRGQHVLLGRPAAVKLLKPELTTNDELVERFVNEAKAASAIRHPGIVEVYDFGYVDDGRAYIVMELLDGESLSQRLERGPLAETDAAWVARGIASALKAAHKVGIIHRDLKPHNVFLVPDADDGAPRTKVLDFGIAKLANLTPPDIRFTQTGALIGTPMYMAPEQARAAATIDHRADLYSLGCILYEMLVGAPPFVAEGAGEVIAMQMFTPVVPPGQRLASITPELEHLVMRLLEKEPEKRPQNAGEVVTALAAAWGRLSSQLSAPIPVPAEAFAPSGPSIAASGMPAGGFAQSGPLIAASGMPSGGFAAPVPPLPLSGPRMLGPAGGALPRVLDERRPELPPAKRSAMPLIAGAITIAIAGGVIGIVATRGGSSDEPAAAAPPPAAMQPSPPAAVAPPKPVPPKPAPPKPAPPKPVPPPAKIAAPVKHDEVAKPPVAAKHVTPPVAHPPVTHPPAVAKHPPAKPGDKPTTTPSGPVTKPDVGGAVTSISDVDPPKTGPHSPGNSPIEHDVSLGKKKKAPAPAPVKKDTKTP